MNDHHGTFRASGGERLDQALSRALGMSVAGTDAAPSDEAGTDDDDGAVEGARPPHAATSSSATARPNPRCRA